MSATNHPDTGTYQDRWLDVEVDRVPVLSMAHVTETEGKKDADELPIAALGWAYGWQVYVGDWAENLTPADDWPGLRAVCAWAEVRGFKWVRLDGDAPRHKNLSTYDW